MAEIPQPKRRMIELATIIIMIGTYPVICENHPHKRAVFVGIRILELQLVFPGHFNQVDRNTVADNQDCQAKNVLGF